MIKQILCVLSLLVISCALSQAGTNEPPPVGWVQPSYCAPVASSLSPTAGATTRYCVSLTDIVATGTAANSLLFGGYSTTHFQAVTPNLTTFSGIAPSSDAQLLLGMSYAQMLTAIGAQPSGVYLTAETDPLVNALGKATLSPSIDQTVKWSGSAWITTAFPVSGGASSLAELSDWPAAVSAAEVGYLDGLTGSITSLLAGKQAAGSYLTSETDPTVSSAISAHAGAADPHTGYALEAALGTAATKNTGTAIGNVPVLVDDGNSAASLAISSMNLPTLGDYIVNGVSLDANADGDIDSGFLPSASSLAWGNITGTLSAQTDLNTALGLKAPLASPALTGAPTAPTATAGTNTSQIATTAFVTTAVAAGASGIVDRTDDPADPADGSWWFNTTTGVLKHATTAGLYSQTMTLAAWDLTPTLTTGTLTDVTDATASTLYLSAPYTVAGGNHAMIVDADNSGYTINSTDTADCTTDAGTVVNGDLVRACNTSSASNSTQTDTVLTVGTSSDTYSVTTEAAAIAGSWYYSQPTDGGYLQNIDYNYVKGARVTIGTSTDITSIGFKVYSTAGAPTCKIALYNTATPSVLLANGTCNPVSGEWCKADVSYSATANTIYRVVMACDYAAQGPTVTYGSTIAGQGGIISALPIASFPPNPYTFDNVNYDKVSTVAICTGGVCGDAR